MEVADCLIFFVLREGREKHFFKATIVIMITKRVVRISTAWYKMTGGSDSILQQKTTETIIRR